jgi:hypothetical protein
MVGDDEGEALGTLGGGQDEFEEGEGVLGRHGLDNYGVGDKW